MRCLTPISLSLGVVFALVACGGEEPVPDAGDTPAASETIDEAISAFIHAADQFGIEQFKVVYDLEGQETGTRTMWVEAHGSRVAIEDQVTVYRESQHTLAYWDGERMHIKTLPDGEVYSTRIRTKASEPTSFGTSSASDLELVGYERVGDRMIAGKSCEHWRQVELNFEGCRWERIELEFLNGAGTDRIIQRSTATEVVVGEAIPERFKALSSEP